MSAISEWILACAISAAPPADAPADLAGLYDGGQTEVAAVLALQPDGRFEYGLSYGALDERAEGTWRREGKRVILTSDPVRSPAFDVVEQKNGPAGTLSVAVSPDGRLPVQLFDVRAHFADGRTATVQMEEEGVRIPFEPADPPHTVTLVLPMFDIESAPIALASGTGHRLLFTFRPNDLGRVAFDGTPLELGEDGLRLTRYDRQLVFRRVQRPADARRNRMIFRPSEPRRPARLGTASWAAQPR